MIHLPNIYGAGAGFGFSGLEGPAGLADDFVGLLTGDRIGVCFEFPGGHQTLAFELEPGVREIEYKLVVNDTVDAQLTKGGENGRLVFMMTEHKALAGYARFAKPVVIASSAYRQYARDDCVVTEGPDAATALYVEAGAFTFAYDPVSADAAIARAKSAVKADLDALMAKRLSFYYALPPCPAADNAIERAYYKAFSILKHNVQTAEGGIKGLWTTPDRLPHRNMWLWDSCFHSVGLRYIGEELAARAVEAVLEQQHEDGFIPHMMTPTGCSDITQPPLLAWALELCYRRTGDKSLVERNLPKLRAYLEWNLRNRDINGNLLCEWAIEGDPRCRSGESGMDNSQRFDEAATLDAVDFSCFMKNEYDCLARLEDELGYPDESARSREKADAIGSAINKFLWNDKLGIYADRKMDGGISDVAAISGFLPLWAGVATAERAERLRLLLVDPLAFNTPMPLPSASASDPEYSTDMWRGGVWMNYLYMVVNGLRRYGMNELAANISAMAVNNMTRWYMQCGSLYEYYHAENILPPQMLDRKGPTTPPVDIRRKIFCIADYGWTAAVFIALLHENETCHDGI